MIQNIYVMKENGELLYHSNLSDVILDENLITGFLAAVGNFSREAFKNLIEALDIDDERKLLLYFQQAERFLCAAIVDDRDDNELVHGILRQFCSSIIEEYGNKLDPEYIKPEILDADLKRILKGKVAARKPKNFFFGLISAFILWYPLFLGAWNVTGLIVTSILGSILGNDARIFDTFLPVMILIIILYVFIMYLIPMMLAGFVSGQFKSAIWVGIFYHAFLTLIYVVMGKQTEILLLISLAFTPVVVIFMMFFLYVGVRIAGKKKLYK
ncbi:MAG: hypothetical protein ACFFCS_19495 [Candidatus Hodarchaeota archaeon]